MTKRFTTAGAMIAIGTVSGNYFLALGRGQSATGLVDEIRTGGYARQAVTIVSQRTSATNAGPVTFGAFTATEGPASFAGLYTAERGGTCIWVGPLATAIDIVAGGTATIPAGTLVLTIEMVDTKAAAIIAPANTELPAITGQAQEGQTLTASTGTWTGTAPITYAFQWQRGTAAIAGATAATYAVQAADVGQTLRVVVTASNAAGSAQATSAATQAVTAAPLPGISVTTPVGPLAVASPVAVSGTYSGAMASATLAWEQNGNSIGSSIAITSFSGGEWTATITSPAVAGTYRLRAAFNGTAPTATSGDVTIGVAEDTTIASFTFDGSGDAADTVAVFGHAFDEGLLRPTTPIVLRRADNNTPLRTQMTPLATWPDGSIRTAAFACELPALADGTLLRVNLRPNESHPSPGAALSWSGALAGRSVRIRTWAPGNTTTPLWTYDVAAALETITDDWMAGPLALCRRVKTAVPASAVQNSSGQTGTIESVRLVVDVTATKDGMLLVDAAFCNDRVNHVLGGTARFGWTIEIDGQVVYDQRPSSGAARDLLQYNWWIRRRAKKGTRVYDFYSTFRPLFRPDFAALVRAKFTLNYDTTVRPSVDASGIAQRFSAGAARLNDPYWSWGLARDAGMPGGRPEIGFNTAENAVWMAWPSASRVAERLAHIHAEAYATGGWLHWDHETDRPIMVDEWPRFALHWSFAMGAPAPRATATGWLTSQPGGNNATDHIRADQAHRGNYYAPVALLSARRLMYDLVAVRSAEATICDRHAGYVRTQLRSGVNWLENFTQPDVNTGDRWAAAPFEPQVRSHGWQMRDLVQADYLLPDTMPRRDYYTKNLVARVNMFHSAQALIDAELGSDKGLVVMHTNGFVHVPWMWSFMAYGLTLARNAGLGGPNMGAVYSQFVKQRTTALLDDGWARRELDGIDQRFYSADNRGSAYTTMSAVIAGNSVIPAAWNANNQTGVGADYHLNRLNTAALLAAANTSLEDRARARDTLVRFRSERTQASGWPRVNASDFQTAGEFQTNCIIPPGWTWALSSAPVIVAGQSFSARTNVAAGTVIGLVEWTGSIPRCSTASNANHDAFEIVSQPTGNPFTISRGGAIRRASTGTFPSGPTTIQVRCRTYNDANTLLMSQAVPVTIIGT